MQLRIRFLFAALTGAACLLHSSLSARTITVPAHTITVPDNPRMEVAFVLDTTGSMGGMIAGAKQKIWAIANRLKSAQPTPDISFGLVGFRDRGDAHHEGLRPHHQPGRRLH